MKLGTERNLKITKQTEQKNGSIIKDLFDYPTDSTS